MRLIRSPPERRARRAVRIPIGVLAILVCALLIRAASAPADTGRIHGTTSGTSDVGADQPALLELGSGTALSFRVAESGTAAIFFTAECSVASTDTTTWLDVTILVDGIPAPGTDGDDAFCTSSGTGTDNRWVSVGRDAVVELDPGVHSVEVEAVLQGFDAGESWRIDDKTLFVLVDEGQP